MQNLEKARRSGPIPKLAVGDVRDGSVVVEYLPGAWDYDLGRLRTPNRVRFKCSCGAIGETDASRFGRGIKTHCGCRSAQLRKEARRKQAPKQRLKWVGEKFNGIEVLRFMPQRHENGRRVEARAECRCVCGKIFAAYAAKIRSGHTRSCGCLTGKLLGDAKRTHGRTETAEYEIWQSIKTRCLNSRDKGFAKYGAKGVSMCERWARSFEAFFSDMGPKPSPMHSVDRIDPRGPYSRENCRWATPEEQRANQIPTWPNLMNAMRWGFYHVKFSATIGGIS